jgi:hypothetical protein
LVVEAKRLGLSTEEVVGALRGHWERLSRNGAEGVGDAKEGGRRK